MEVIKSFTGVWKSPVFGEFTVDVTETISIIRCDEVYILLRVTDVKSENSTAGETKCTRDYSKALAWYEQWNKDLMWHMYPGRKED